MSTHANCSSFARRALGRFCFLLAAAILPLALLAAASMAAPSFKPNVAPGNCAACHEGKKMVGADHPDTTKMTWKECAACHKKETGGAKTLAMRIPADHYHMLAGQKCAACHKGGKPENLPEQATCKNCHKDYVAKTPDKGELVNPHKNHLGEPDCWVCHTMHKPSVNFCASCHPAMVYKVP